MRYTPRALGATFFGLLAAGMFVAACTDQNSPVLPDPVEPDPLPTLSEVRCVVDVARGTLSCGDPLGGEGANLGRLILGGQGELVQLTSSNIVKTVGAQTDFAFDVTVQNLIRMPFATQDTGSFSAHASGVRVFFVSGPTVTGGSGNIDVFNPDGTGTFTATNQDFFEYDDVNRSGASPMPLFRDEVTMPKNWVLRMDNTVTSFAFTVAVASEVPFWSTTAPIYKGFTDVVPDSSTWRRFREDTVTVTPTGTVQLEGAVRTRLGKMETGSWPITYQTSDAGVATVDGGGLVTGVTEGSALVSGFASQHPSYRRTRVLVNAAPLVEPDSAWALENVKRVVAAPGLLANDTSSTPAEGISVIADTVTTTLNGTAILNVDGSFEYLNAAGVAGVDSFYYRATDGFHVDSALVTLTVENSRIWYVRQGATGDGTDQNPFGTFAAALAVAAPGDSLLFLDSGSDLTEVVTLEAGTAVVGTGIAADLTHTLGDATVITVLAAGTAPTLTSAGNTLTLAGAPGNRLEGFTLTSTNGAGITGSSFGTLTVGNGLSVNTTGAALSLTTGAVAGTFDLLTSTGGTHGLSLTGVTGTVTITAGSLSGNTTASVLVSGGSVSFTYPGNVTQGNNVPMISVAGGHTGSLTFSGTLNATSGTGTQFSDADGVYTFNGTATLNGGDAGVDITAASDGTFTFGTGFDITSPSGVAFLVSGSTPTVTFSGDIAQANNAAMVSVSDQAADSVRFLTGTLAATNGTGLQLSNADGVVRFLGTVTLNGGDAGVDVVSGSGGTLQFPALTVTNPSGVGITVDGSGGSMTFGATTVNKGATNGGGVVLNSNAGATITFASLGVNTSNGEPLRVVNSGTVNVTTGTGSLTSAQQNTGLTVSGTAVAMNFTNISVTNPHNSSGPTPLNGIVLTNVTGAGITVSGSTTIQASGAQANLAGIQVTGSSAAFDFGTTAVNSITGTAGTAAVRLDNNTGTVTFDALTTGSLGTGIRGLHVTSSAGTVTVSDGFLRTTGESALLASTASLALTLDSIGTQSPAATSGVSLTTTSGSVSASGGAINGGTVAPIVVSGGSVNLTFAGSVTQAANAALLSVAGGHTGTLQFLTGTLNASNGSGLQFDNADGTYDFDGPVTLNGGDAGIDVANNSDGVFTFPTAAAITSPSTGNLITISNSVSPFSFTYSGGLTRGASNITAILIQNNGGSTVTFDGDATSADGDPADVARTFSTGTAAAVSLVNNGGSTINFNGGGLAITTGSGAGFNATGGGTVNVTGAGNSVNSTGGGTAVNIQNTTIGGSGVSFYSVSATGGGTNGIVLSNTGAGGFQVTGDGASDLANTTRGRTTARSGGGSIVLGSGGTISGKSGDGVSVATTGALTLRNMVISGGSADGIDAATVSGAVTLDNLQVTGHTNNRGVSVVSASGLKVFHSEIGNNATSAGAGAASLYNLQLSEVTGTDSIMSSHLHTAFGFVFRAANTSGTLNLRVQNTNIVGATDGIAAGLYPAGSSNVTAVFENDSIGHSSARGLQVATGTGSSAVMNLTVNNTAFRNNFVGLDVAHGSGGTHTFNLTNNRLQTNVASSAMAINVNRLGSPAFNAFGLFTGTVSGNVIGTAGTANSGSDTGSGIEVESNGSGGITRVAVVSNTIREVGTHGIYVAAVDANIGGTAPPLLEARIASNSVSNLEALALDGIHVLPGALNTDDLTMCVDIANNNSTGIRNGLRVRPSGLPAAPSTIQLEGWDGVTARSTYFTARPNTLAGGVAAYAEGVPSAPGGFVAVANCNTP